MAFDNDETVVKNRNHSWWNRRTRLEKKGVVLLVIAILIIIGLIIGIAVIAKKLKDKSNDVCVTSGCVKAATTVIQNMDQSVNPCGNFYEFACGGFIKDTYIPEDKISVDYFTIVGDSTNKKLKAVFEKPTKEGEPKAFSLVKQLYKICMNTTAIEKAGLTSVKNTIKEIGGWPVLEGSNWNENAFAWITSMHNFRKHGLDVNSFIKIGITHDAENSTRRIIIIDQPETDLLLESLLGGWEDATVKVTYDYMVDLAVLFGANRAIAQDDVKKVINLMTEIAKISLNESERRDPAYQYNPMTIAELQNKYRSIPWTELINGIINHPERNDLTPERINIKIPRYLERLEGVLSQASKRDLANYAFFKTLRSMSKYLPETISKRTQQLQNLFSGTTAEPARWEKCVEVVSERLPIATGAMYVRKYFNEESKKAVGEMITDIRKELIKIIEKLQWMDENTRKKAIQKANAMKLTIGYPAEFLDDNELNEYYAKLNITSKTYFDAITKIVLFGEDTDYADLNLPVNKSDWRMRQPVTITNAGYIVQENNIEVAAGILQGVYYDKDRPRYMNYGAIGYILGHELTHGFDDQGKRYNEVGDLANWWEEKTNQKYADKAKCFVKQYGDIVVPEFGINVNGELTQGENIADNGGIKEAYLAYKSWVKRNGPEPALPGLNNYTSNQLFWISAANCWCLAGRSSALYAAVTADEHAPARYRVNIPFGNIKYFAEDFNCGPDAKMIQKQKCEIW